MANEQEYSIDTFIQAYIDKVPDEQLTLLKSVAVYFDKHPVDEWSLFSYKPTSDPLKITVIEGKAGKTEVESRNHYKV